MKQKKRQPEGWRFAIKSMRRGARD